MNIRDYPASHLEKKINKKERFFYCCSRFHSHSIVFINDHSEYYKISVKWAYLAAEQNFCRQTLHLGIFLVVMLFGV